MLRVRFTTKSIGCAVHVRFRASLLYIQSIVDGQGVTSSQRLTCFGLYLGQSLINIPKTQIVRSAGRGLSNEPTPEVQLARVPEL